MTEGWERRLSAHSIQTAVERVHNHHSEDIDWSCAAAFAALDLTARARAVETLSVGRTLQRITLRGLSLSDSIAPALVSLLRSHQPLRHVDLSSNAFRENGLLAISGAIEGHPTLEELDVSNQHASISAHAVIALCNAAAAPPALCHLRLGHVRDPDARIRAEGMQFAVRERRRARRQSTPSPSRHQRRVTSPLTPVHTVTTARDTAAGPSMPTQPKCDNRALAIATPIEHPSNSMGSDGVESAHANEATAVAAETSPSSRALASAAAVTDLFVSLGRLSRRLDVMAAEERGNGATATVALCGGGNAEVGRREAGRDGDMNGDKDDRDGEDDAGKSRRRSNPLTDDSYAGRAVPAVSQPAPAAVAATPTTLLAGSALEAALVDARINRVLADVEALRSTGAADDTMLMGRLEHAMGKLTGRAMGPPENCSREDVHTQHTLDNESIGQAPQERAHQTFEGPVEPCDESEDQLAQEAWEAWCAWWQPPRVSSSSLKQNTPLSGSSTAVTHSSSATDESTPCWTPPPERAVPIRRRSPPAPGMRLVSPAATSHSPITASDAADGACAYPADALTPLEVAEAAAVAAERAAATLALWASCVASSGEPHEASRAGRQEPREKLPVRRRLAHWDGWSHPDGHHSPGGAQASQSQPLQL